MLKYFFTFFLFCTTFLTGAEVKAIVFDFGKVLATTNAQHIVTFAKETLHLTDAEISEAIRKCPCTIDQLAWDLDFWKQFTDLPPNWESAFEETKQHAVIPYPDTIALAHDLKKAGYPLILFSNVIPEKAKLFRSMGLYDLFNPVILSCEIDARKPDPKAYKALLESVNYPPEALFFIDDHPENIAAAKTFGISGTPFTTAENLRYELIKQGILIGTN